jgi:iron complex transport system substrate-binding protein
LCLSPEAGPWSVAATADRRVVILAPAAADLLERLGAGESVVGVTNSVNNFLAAAKVGTHLSPGVEKIASLRPGLIIATSRFNPELAERLGAELFVYEPKTLDEIVESARRLSRLLNREEQGRRLAGELESILASLVAPPNRPTALYETRSAPLSVAGGNTIIKDLLERAGLRYVHSANTGTMAAEYLMANQPEYYFYQDGPMNRNPVPPAERPGWENFRACAWKVDEFDFARPNTGLFETARLLNAALNAENPCARGTEIFRR